MPTPERETMDLETWNEICRRRDAGCVALTAEQGEQYQPELAAQAGNPQQERTRLWASIVPFTLPYTLIIGWAGTLIFGLCWIPGLPSGLASETYRPVPAQITLFEPIGCGKRSDGAVSHGLHYTYSYQGQQYQSSRVLPFPFGNDYLDNCGASFYRALRSGTTDPQTGNILTTVYVNPLMPSVAVLRRGLPFSLTGLFGLFSLFCMILTLWGIKMDTSLTKKDEGKPKESPEPPKPRQETMDLKTWNEICRRGEAGQPLEIPAEPLGRPTIYTETPGGWLRRLIQPSWERKVDGRLIIVILLIWLIAAIILMNG